jgi:hypothetical protein
MNNSTRKRAVINECLTVLTHSRKCEDDECTTNRCTPMKNVWKHFNECPENKKSSPKCPVCNSVISLLDYHAKECQNDSCTMPRCPELKSKYTNWRKIQESEQIFLTKLVKFRLSTVPTVIKQQCPKNITKAPATVKNDQPNNSVDQC